MASSSRTSTMLLFVGLLALTLALAHATTPWTHTPSAYTRRSRAAVTPFYAGRRGGADLRNRQRVPPPPAAAAAQPHMGNRRMMAASIPNPLAFLKTLGRMYSNWMMEQPIRANLISGILMVALGDGISQAIEVDSKTGLKKCTSWRELSPRRLANAGFAGAVFNGVLLPQWYLLLHKLSPGAETAKTIAAKILGNCVAWGCVGNAAIMAMRRMLDGESWAQTERAVRRDLWGVMKNDYKIWPLYDVLCFTCIPRHMHGLSTGTLGILWATYLSYVTHTEEH